LHIIIYILDVFPLRVHFIVFNFFVAYFIIVELICILYKLQNHLIYFLYDNFSTYEFYEVDSTKCRHDLMLVTNGESLRDLGFIKRIYKEFNSPLILKILYCPLIRSSLEYEITIWNLSQQGIIDEIEKILWRFLRFCVFKVDMSTDSCDEITNCSGIKSIKSRHLVFDLCFLDNLLNGFIDCPEILAKIDLKVPYFYSRFNPPFVIPNLSNNNYCMNSQICRL